MSLPFPCFFHIPVRKSLLLSPPHSQTRGEALPSETIFFPTPRHSLPGVRLHPFPTDQEDTALGGLHFSSPSVPFFFFLARDGMFSQQLAAAPPSRFFFLRDAAVFNTTCFFFASPTFCRHHLFFLAGLFPPSIGTFYFRGYCPFQRVLWIDPRCRRYRGPARLCPLATSFLRQEKGTLSLWT